MQRLILPYLSGFLSVLFFQQAMIGMLHAAGLSAQMPFDLTPAPAFGVPNFLVSAIAAGVYAVVMAWVFRIEPYRPAPWIPAFVFGAIVPTALSIFVLGPVQGVWPSGNILPRVAFGAVCNGFWGWGTLIMIRAFISSAGFTDRDDGNA
ncbi:membrane protein [Robbsia andropogonis]|uniref:Membrane protein n=2 Tax=Robbsia andropogonis TaxID=28092 RepID=A0A0F5JTD4_9BURK|nr:hypothetical protein [Robbsia andropogonis]KKB61096.1 membrane protein [Robbsia andropogonis]MCP1120967.1 hypothetical protein [Robbsia andropogonis]MCP1130752.1 hypothetical protein [Robbsia andropogonis]